MSDRIYHVSKETPSGSVNSSNTVFTLVGIPDTNSEHVYVNGRLTYDYTVSSRTITFTYPPITGDYISVSYRYSI